MLTERFRKNILNIITLVHNNDWDWLWVNDGDERSGKSSLSMQILLIAEPKLNDKVLSADYKPVLSRIAWNFDAWIDVLKTLKPGSVSLYDEASLLGREAMKEHNLRMIRILTTVGMRNNLMLMTFPDIYMLDPYIRDGRCRTRGYVYSVDGERGYVSLWVRRRYPFPRASGETVWWARAFGTRFSSISNISNCHEELWELYRERDEEAKNKILTGGHPDIKIEITRKLRKEGMSIQKIAGIVGMSHGWVGNIVKGRKPGGDEA